MSAARPLTEIPPSIAAPQLLVELPSRRRVFYENLHDVIFARALPPLELRSAPAPFWPDVIVERSLPWQSFLQSATCHVIAFALLIGLTRFFALQPRVTAMPAFDHSQAVYYQPSEYLPPLNTLSLQKARTAKADAELSRQPIISLPREADNRSQTIVTPPNVKLKRDVTLPNIVAWSEKISDNMTKPRLDIPAVPLTPAAEISRIAPPLQRSVVAPPPDLRTSKAAALQTPQPAVIAPPPALVADSRRTLGDLNIAQSSIIAPAPQLPLAEQRALPGSLSAAIGAPQLVSPPPSFSTSGYTGDFGARGRIIALSLHPAVGAPPTASAGNRRAAFAATPEGHAGASGVAGTKSGNSNAGAGGNNAVGNGSDRKGTSNAPEGLYVGSAAAKASPVAGNNSSTNTVNPNLLASVRPPRVSSAASRPMKPDSAAKLSDAERAVFGNRKFYSVTLNMPNLNSAGGSWVIRFAELNHNPNNHDVAGRDTNSSADLAQANPAQADLSQPTATRKVDPAYPLQIMRENVSGTVILYAIIRADGSVGSVRVLRGVDDRLDQFASQAVAQWQFQPATKNGTPVDVEATFQIPFRPSRAGTNF